MSELTENNPDLCQKTCNYNSDLLQSDDPRFCKKNHPEKMIAVCKFNKECHRYGCYFRHHPDHIQDCNQGSGCENRDTCTFKHPDVCSSSCIDVLRDPDDQKYCKKQHPSKMKDICKYDMDCYNVACTFRHSPIYVGACVYGSNCSKHPDMQEYLLNEQNICNKIHPKKMNRICSHGLSCRRYGCYDRHPLGSKKDCSKGLECDNKECNFKHPAKRTFWNNNIIVRRI